MGQTDLMNSVFGPWALERSRLDAVVATLQSADISALSGQLSDNPIPAYTTAEGVAQQLGSAEPAAVPVPVREWQWDFAL